MYTEFCRELSSGFLEGRSFHDEGSVPSMLREDAEPLEVWLCRDYSDDYSVMLMSQEKEENSLSLGVLQIYTDNGKCPLLFNALGSQMSGYSLIPAQRSVVEHNTFP